MDTPADPATPFEEVYQSFLDDLALRDRRARRHSDMLHAWQQPLDSADYASERRTASGRRSRGVRFLLILTLDRSLTASRSAAWPRERSGSAPSSPCEFSGSNLDNRLPRASLGRVEDGDGIIECRDNANVGP